jgi:hypothetical protein
MISGWGEEIRSSVEKKEGTSSSADEIRIDRFVYKPFNSEDLKKAVEEVC